MSTRSILLADDSKTVRTLVSRALTQAGYHVITAADGVAAVEMAREHKPSLAVLDIVMPGLDGYGVCERLKAMGPPWDHLPIVFLTCVNSKALELLGNAYGAYLRKPVQPDLLLAAIEQQIASAFHEG
jgi:CheY-like chemotaxis protein